MLGECQEHEAKRMLGQCHNVGKMMGTCWTNAAEMLRKWWENAGKIQFLPNTGEMQGSSGKRRENARGMWGKWGEHARK
jgi:hypothetical protein